ncbi:MAG TPA: NUDIX domain-containing protein [Steroidobacteraceae bacterium]|nr:NUDIX domain-containing protein [Steroidobacteraceae bacterium]
MSETTPVSGEHIRFVGEQVLSDDWYLLRKITFDYRRQDGSWQRQAREVYDRGNGAAILLYNVARLTVLLTRQFRMPAYVNGCPDGLLIEACAGLLDGEEPAACIKREAEEETGFEVRAPRQVFAAYMSPGSVTERLHFFVAEYQDRDRVSRGGGEVNEGEEIETLEMDLDEAMRMIDSGAIQDGKTIMLLQYAHRIGLKNLMPQDQSAP